MSEIRKQNSIATVETRRRGRENVRIVETNESGDESGGLVLTIDDWQRTTIDE